MQLSRTETLRSFNGLSAELHVGGLLLADHDGILEMKVHQHKDLLDRGMEDGMLNVLVQNLCSTGEVCEL